MGVFLCLVMADIVQKPRGLHKCRGRKQIKIRVTLSGINEICQKLHTLIETNKRETEKENFFLQVTNFL